MIEWGRVLGAIVRYQNRLWSVLANSDIDIYLDFSEKPTATKQLKAEGRVIEAFGETKVDVVSRLDTIKGQRLLMKIKKDGVRVF